jgi:hypothetical protein
LVVTELVLHDNSINTKAVKKNIFLFILSFYITPISIYKELMTVVSKFNNFVSKLTVTTICHLGSYWYSI